MANINGTSGRDQLLGTEDSDLIRAFSEGDNVLAGGGDDLVNGAKGDDKVDDTSSSGSSDCALIADFTEKDAIQLVGEANEYLLGSFPKGLPSGTVYLLMMAQIQS